MSAFKLQAELLMAARAKAVGWILDHLGSDGRPAGSEQGNGWSRVSWVLALTGETVAASAVLEWALREGIDDDGSFYAGPPRGTGVVGPYFLGQVAMGALHLERYDVSRRILDQLEALQDEAGGIPLALPDGALSHIADITSTAQAGIAALLGGRIEMARRIRDWMLGLLESQPYLPSRLYVGRIGEELLTTPPPAAEWMLAVDYTQPRQAYYHSGIAAAFLATYALATGDQTSLAGAHRFIALNAGGTEAQFSDPDSVQICKFGWGVALTQVADASVDYGAHLLRMSKWFVEHQDGDGSWTPSRFQSPTPSIVERMMKTAEHAMEVTALIAGLATHSARIAAPQRVIPLAEPA